MLKTRTENTGYMFLWVIFYVIYLKIYQLSIFTKIITIIVAASPDNHMINGILMAITGFFINGTANIISSAVAADLGRSGQISIKLT